MFILNVYDLHNVKTECTLSIFITFTTKPLVVNLTTLRHGAVFKYIHTF